MKWFYIVWRREACKKMKLSWAVNLTEAVDSAGDNMRTWYMHIVIAATVCAFFVSPRMAAACTAFWSFTRLFTPLGMIANNPIPQTALMSIGTIAMYRWMLYSFFEQMTNDVLPDWLFMALQPMLTLDLALLV